MDFEGNLLLFAAVKEFSRIDKVIAMVRVVPFLTHSVVLAIYHLGIAPSRGLNTRGVAKCSDFGPIEG